MKVKINKKTYEVQELQIGAYTHIEEQGFSIVDAIQKRQHMLLAVALVCGVVGYDRAEAEHIVEQHILGRRERSGEESQSRSEEDSGDGIRIVSCTQFIQDYWLPRAIRSGVPMTDFYKLTPKIINAYAKEYERKTQEQCDLLEYSAWLHGSYVQSAIASAFIKEVSYPENPLLKKNEEIEEETANEDPYVGEAQFLQFISALNKKFDD